jgi:hypothetical protein
VPLLTLPHRIERESEAHVRRGLRPPRRKKGGHACERVRRVTIAGRRRSLSGLSRSIDALMLAVGHISP